MGRDTIFQYLMMKAKKVYESIDFKRGQDPKSSMGVGTECRTFHAGSIRYNRGSTTYLDPEMAKRVLSGDDTLYHKYFISVPGSCGLKGFYMDDLQDPHNPYCYIEYLGEIYPVPGKIHESVDFQRGKDPKSAMDIGVEDQILDVRGVRRESKSTMAEMELPEKTTIDLLKNPIKYAFRNKRFGYTIITPDNKGEFLRNLINPDWNDGYKYFRYKGELYPIEFEQNPIISESIYFERGKDPRKTMEIGRVRPYPQMSPEEFADWFDEEIGEYLSTSDQAQAILDNLVGNDWETDKEVSGYLYDRNVDRDLINEMIHMRDYFNDERYINKIRLAKWIQILPENWGQYMRAKFVNEEKFERGQDPKRAMEIGTKPFTIDELEDAFEGSEVQRLVGDMEGNGDLWDLIDEDSLPDEPEVDPFTKFKINGTIDHPMSGYGGSYNEAHPDLTVERLPNGKIHTYGTYIMEVGDMEYEEEDYDQEYGERVNGRRGKPKKVEYFDDSLEDLFNGLEELPQ